jgi:hypothetical protein
VCEPPNPPPFLSVELQTRDAFAVREDGGLTEVPQVTAIKEGFQDVLLRNEHAASGKTVVAWVAARWLET